VDDFISKYLIIDKDNDYVLKQSPCDFLNDDNTCFIYDHRPKACREYPHTNRKNFHKISQITLKNIEICPATFNIVEKLKLILKNNS
jgi:Fe-S-cluster containining protein